MADTSNSNQPPPSPAKAAQPTSPTIADRLNGAGSTAMASGSAAPAAPSQLSNADKKKLAKAEKQAKRAKAKEALGGADVQSSTTVNGAVKGADDSTQVPAAKQQLKQDRQSGATGLPSAKGPSKRRESGTVANPAALPIRNRRGSHSQRVVPKEETKQVPIFSHLYSASKKSSLEGTPKDVHPAIAALGLQISSYVVCGSQARCVAMLKVLKSVIASYVTPHGTSLPRHLSSHFLSPQLQYIKSARAFSVTQANAIRWLKNLIANIDPSVPERTAKSDICTAIDTFIRERFTVADQVITEAVTAQIVDGDCVVTYANSAVVQQALLHAARQGRKFSVIVVDSRPLFEGKSLAATLSAADIEVSYCLVNGLAHAISKATVCILGAHAILGNGALYSRVGTALVAMRAREHSIPVSVCAESIKFTDRVSLDSIVINEVAPEDELLPSSDGDIVPGVNGQKPFNWREKDNLQVLNIMHDLTPARYIDMIITELGNLPPTSAAAVHRISAGPGS